MKTIVYSDLLGYELILAALRLVEGAPESVSMREGNRMFLSCFPGRNFSEQQMFLDMYQRQQWQLFVSRAEEYCGMAGLCPADRANSAWGRLLQSLLGTSIVTTALMRSRPRWRRPGLEAILVGPGGKEYPAIEFKRDSYFNYPKNERAFDVYTLNRNSSPPTHPYPLICLHTSHNRRVWIMRYDEEIGSKEDVSHVIMKANEAEKWDKGGAIELRFPQVDVRCVNHDFGFLRGLGVYRERIGEVFARIDLSFAPTIFCEETPVQESGEDKLVYKKVVVDGPFVFWITTDSDDTVPILAGGYITPKDWHKPQLVL